MSSHNWDFDQIASFGKRRGCLDAHVSSENIVQTFKRVFNKSLNVSYIDFRKAYDSVGHKALKAVLRYLFGHGSPATQRLLNALTTLMGSWHTYVVNLGDTPKKINITKGIFQGDKMSPTLFCLALSLFKPKVLGGYEPEDSVNWSAKICYMDDIKIFGGSIGALEKEVGNIKRLGELLGLKINEQKSALITEEPRGRLAFTQHLKDFPLISNEGTTQYKYLGFKQVWVNTKTTKDDMKKEAQRRIRKICGSGLTIVNCGKQLQVSVAPL
jgi:hypothetical protein